MLKISAVFVALMAVGMTSPAYAVSCTTNGTNASSSTSAAACQHAVVTNEVAPAPADSSGIRQNHAVVNVLYDNGAAYSICRYVDNTGSVDLFVPQGKIEDFAAFVNNHPNYVTLGLCVRPTTVTATPSVSAYYQIYSEGGDMLNGNGTDTQITGIPVPSTNAVSRFFSLTTTTSTSVDAGGNAIAFLYKRDDCKMVNGSAVCNHWVIKEVQTITMTSSQSVGSGLGQTYVWANPTVSSKWYMSAAETGPWSPILGPNRNYNGPLNADGVCGGDNDKDMTTAPTDLCASGTPSAVTGTSSPWTWTCAGSNGGATVSCATKSTCPATLTGGSWEGATLTLQPTPSVPATLPNGHKYCYYTGRTHRTSHFGSSNDDTWGAVWDIDNAIVAGFQPLLKVLPDGEENLSSCSNEPTGYSYSGMPLGFHEVCTTLYVPKYSVTQIGWREIEASGGKGSGETVDVYSAMYGRDRETPNGRYGYYATDANGAPIALLKGSMHVDGNTNYYNYYSGVNLAVGPCYWGSASQMGSYSASWVEAYGQVFAGYSNYGVPQWPFASHQVVASRNGNPVPDATFPYCTYHAPISAYH